MFISFSPMRPVVPPRHRVPMHVPDAGSGLILMSVITLLFAAIMKKLGFFARRQEQ